MIMNAEEVFELAAQIERNGVLFYKKAGEITTLPESKVFLKRLADMENDHEALFIKIKNKCIKRSENTFQDSDALAIAYLNAMAEGEVFDVVPPDKQLTGKETVKDIYKMALEFEKKSIIFFTAIKKIVPEKKDRKKIDLLINEELGHIAILAREISVLNK